QAQVIAERLARLTGLQAESWMATNGQLLNALRSQSMTTQMIRIFVGLSVAFGIASVLAVSVVQRTREIGILRAMGSPRRQILRVFLVQGGLLGLVGSGFGGLVGWSLIQVFNIFGPKLFIINVDASLVPIPMAVATVTGGLAGAAPARRAARHEPAGAIRYVRARRRLAPDGAAQGVYPRHTDEIGSAARSGPAPATTRIDSADRAQRRGQ